jgi:hypothetical protein
VSRPDGVAGLEMNFFKFPVRRTQRANPKTFARNYLLQTLVTA